MTWWIVGYLVVGAVFGLVTYAHRHRFSEGTTRRSGGDERDPLDSRAMWVMLSTGLWPIYVLTGAFNYMRKPRQP